MNSIKSLFEQKKHRSGYTGKLYNDGTFKQFIESANPYLFLSEMNKIKMDEESKQYLTLTKPVADYDYYFQDLKVLGKKRVTEFDNLEK